MDNVNLGGNVVDLSDYSRKQRRELERSKKKKKKLSGNKVSFIGDAGTTIGIFVNIIMWSVNIRFDKEYLTTVGDGCNYQLQTLAHAYGLWNADPKVLPPVIFKPSLRPSEDGEGVDFHFDILGEMANEVKLILQEANADLETLDGSETVDE